MIYKSIWLQGIKTKTLPSLKEDITTDVLIIGGGITGISTAYYLSKSNMKVTLVDSNQIGLGVTSKTTGKLTYLQELLYNKIQHIYGFNTAKKYLESQKYAIEIVKNIIINNDIKCDFESNSSYVFTDQNNNIHKLKDLKAFLNNAYNDCKVITHLPIKYPCKYAIKVDDTFVFHPLKYVLALKEICLKRGINIYEKTKIIDLEKKDNYYLAKTNNNVIKAKKVVLACHYPFFITPSFFPFKTYLEKSYVASGIVDKNKKFNAISCNDSTHSIRYYSSKKDYLIYAGLSKSLGYNMNNEKNFHDLFWHIQSNLTTDIKYSWFNYDVITPDGLPLIGYYNKDQNLLIGTGYNTWGMTNGSLAGKILSDLILDKKNKYQELFDPNRQINISKIINMIGSNVDTGLTYITSKLKKNYSFYPDNIKIVYRHGKRCGIYTDHLNKEHVVNTLCPHMKCNLIFNNIDKTWDCPCHGSRFDIDGKVIKGPSVYNISVNV